jgi:hypothetical protein
MFLTCGFTGGSTEPYSELPGQSMITCVRGASAPKNQCVLAGEFAVGSRS